MSELLTTSASDVVPILLVAGEVSTPIRLGLLTPMSCVALLQ